MSYVMNSKYVKHKSKGEHILSDLQKKILRSIRTTKNADYHSLQKDTLAILYVSNVFYVLQ